MLCQRSREKKAIVVMSHDPCPLSYFSRLKCSPEERKKNWNRIKGRWKDGGRNQKSKCNTLRKLPTECTGTALCQNRF